MSNFSSPSSSWLFKNLDMSKPPLAAWRVSDLETTSTTTTTNNTPTSDTLMSLDNYESVGSYNWSRESRRNRAVAIIPGEASTLRESLPVGQQLYKSQRRQIVDENGHYQPDYPLEVLFRAVRLCSPQFEFVRVHFVTDRNNMRKLLKFVERTSDESFRIDFQRIGNTTI